MITRYNQSGQGRGESSGYELARINNIPAQIAYDPSHASCTLQPTMRFYLQFYFAVLRFVPTYNSYVLSPQVQL